jgi:transposase
VPHALLRETLWARITARSIELFHQGNRVAVHVRSSSNRRHTTVREHMPSSHRRYADWTPERIQRRASEIGPKTSALIEIILRERTHPEQGFRATIGILRHASNFGRDPTPSTPRTLPKKSASEAIQETPCEKDCSAGIREGSQRCVARQSG